MTQDEVLESAEVADRTARVEEPYDGIGRVLEDVAPGSMRLVRMHVPSSA